MQILLPLGSHAGEIVFHNGSPALVPSMTWQYWEPRAVSRLHMLPIPLPVSHQENSPIAWSSLKVGRSLKVGTCMYFVVEQHIQGFI